MKKKFEDRSISILDIKAPLFVHHYNATWRNERCIEIALALEVLKNWQTEDILEVGNVLSYYHQSHHQVVDKYENSPGIQNIDFSDLPNEKRYKGFMAISTFEHIGWDESPREPGKLLRCLHKIPKLIIWLTEFRRN